MLLLLRVLLDASPPPVPEGQGGAGGSLIELDGYGEGWAVPAADEESGVLRGEFENLWPLQLVDLNDEEMVGTLFTLLRRLPQVCKLQALSEEGFIDVCVVDVVMPSILDASFSVSVYFVGCMSRVIREEGPHMCFVFHLSSAVRALIIIARRVFARRSVLWPLSLVDVGRILFTHEIHCDFRFCCCTLMLDWVVCACDAYFRFLVWTRSVP